MLEVADVVNTTLDLDTSLRRVAEVVRKVIDYQIFAILLLNEKTQELSFRFQVGYPAEMTERSVIKVGEGVTGLAAQRREAVLVGDVSKEANYIGAVPSPLGARGTADPEEPGYRRDQHRVGPAQLLHRGHKRLLTLIASRMAVGIENARLHTRTSRQARTLCCSMKSPANLRPFSIWTNC